MADQDEGNPALALAIYASTAATEAINVLRRHGLIDQSEVDNLITSLTACRTIAGTNPMVIEHAELLTDILQLRFPKT